jgi:hypothetical protein
MSNYDVIVIERVVELQSLATFSARATRCRAP